MFNKGVYMIKKDLLVLILTGVFSVSSVKANTLNKDDMFNQLLNAISANDYASFIENSTPNFKKGLNSQAFQSLSHTVGSQLEKGYDSQYLTVLNQQGVEVHLWKISYKNASHDTLARLVLSDGQVAGFWLQ